MATSPRKHTVPAEGETPRFEAFNELGASVNDIVPVANVTARAQLVSDLVAEGNGPTTARPLFVARGDANPGARIESTTDGTTWVKHAASAGGMTGLTFDANGNAPLTHGLPWTPTAIIALPVVSSSYGTAITIMVRSDGLPNSTQVLLRARTPSGAFTGALPVMWMATAG